MDKDKIKTWIGFTLIVVLVISLFTFTGHLIRKTSRETEEIQRCRSESQKVAAETPQPEKKDSLSDLKKSLEAYKPTPSTEEATRSGTEATTMCKEWANNKLGAEQRFKGRYFSVVGTVEGVGREILGRPYIMLAGSSGYSIQCVFSTEYTSKLAQISSGRRINITGTCDGELLGIIGFKDCAL